MVVGAHREKAEGIDACYNFLFLVLICVLGALTAMVHLIPVTL